MAFTNVSTEYLLQTRYRLQSYILFLSIWQKFENIDSIAVSMVQKALLDVVQAILEQADRLPAMSQSLYRTNVFVYKDTDEIVPYIRNHNDGEQIGYTLTIPDVRAFDVEAAWLQPLEYGLYLPSSAVPDNKYIKQHFH